MLVNLFPSLSSVRRGAARLRAGHLWVYRSDLVRRPMLRPASLVQVRDERGRRLGSALYSSASQIAIRLLSSDDIAEAALPDLVRERIAARSNFASSLARDTDSYRVIFSEADLLPGLIVDKYNDVLSLQALTQAFDRDDLRQVVHRVAGRALPRRQPARAGRSAHPRTGAAAATRIAVMRVPGPHPLLRLGCPLLVAAGLATGSIKPSSPSTACSFHFDALSGQKTGAFLDQRENYAAAARYAHGEALDCFTYQGGFALHLARVCDSVAAVDSSRPALEVAEQNEQLNREHHRCGEIEWIEANAFDLLKDYATAGRQYDTIVLDPPAFAKTKRAVPTALRGYKELNLRALKMLRPGGVLVTCSCSFHVSEGEFLEMLGSAAADAGRRVRVLEKRGAAIDHPCPVPETAT